MVYCFPCSSIEKTAVILTNRRKFARTVSISTEFQRRFLDLAGETGIESKTALAKELGLPYPTFLKITEYGILPKPTTLARLADKFGVSVDYLLGRSERETLPAAAAPAAFAERFETLRKERGETLYRVAENTHIHRNNIAQWVKRGYTPALDDLLLLAEYFGVSADFLLGRTDERD